LTACTPGSAQGPVLSNEYERTLHFACNCVLLKTVYDLVLCVFVVPGSQSGHVPGSGEPTLSGEVYRRTVQNNVIEMWYFMQSQLSQLKHDLEANSPSLQDNNDVDQSPSYLMIKRVSDMLDTGVDYKRLVLCPCQ